MKRPSNGVLVLCGAATVLMFAAVALRFVKPCPCAEQLGEADASAEAVAMASAIVDRGRIIIVDPPLTFDTPRTGVSTVPATVPGNGTPMGPPVAGAPSDIASAAAARLGTVPDPYLKMRASRTQRSIMPPGFTRSSVMD